MCLEVADVVLYPCRLESVMVIFLIIALTSIDVKKTRYLTHV